jgi:hypothetical protein
VVFCSSASLPSSLSFSLLHSISPSFIAAYEPTTSLRPARLMCCMTRTPRPLSRLRPSGITALFSRPPHSLNLARLSRSTNLQYVRERFQWLKLQLHALDRRFRSCLRAISSLRLQITPKTPQNLLYPPLKTPNRVQLQFGLQFRSQKSRAFTCFTVRCRYWLCHDAGQPVWFRLAQ